MLFLWLRLFHVFFIISWFAGLFYLPRIFVNLADTSPEDRLTYDRLLGMAQRLFKFMTPLAVGAIACAFGMVTYMHGWTGQGWIHAKLTLGLLLVGYHFWCWRLLCDFRRHCNRKSHRWFRIFNEIPVFIMFGALYLVNFKPF